MTVASRAILIVEDDAKIRDVLRTILELEPYRVFEAENGERGVIEARSRRPDLMILDLGLPDIDGVEVIKRTRQWSTLPIIVLSARTEETQKVQALEAGADDYVTKPFGSSELTARVKVALRHRTSQNSPSAHFKIGRWRVDIQKRQVTDGKESLHLTPIEFRLLEELGKHAGMVVTHRQLLQQVWGPQSIEHTHYLRGYMKQLREKLELDPVKPEFLLTETGIGYRLVVNDE